QCAATRRSRRRRKKRRRRSPPSGSAPRPRHSRQRVLSLVPCSARFRAARPALPPPMHSRFAPGATGLYHPSNEHDSCGIALVAKLWGEASHAVVEKALDALENLEHRGAEGADPNTGDGAGILLQIPDAFIRAVAGVELPPPGRYGVGVCYLPADPEQRLALERVIEEQIEAEGQRAIWWRDVPVDERHVGDTARLSAPFIRPVVIEASEEI